MMEAQYTNRFERVAVMNRWKDRHPSGEWVIIGIQKWYAGWDSYCYKLCFFGFDIQVWFRTTRKPTHNPQ